MKSPGLCGSVSRCSSRLRRGSSTSGRPRGALLRRGSLQRCGDCLSVQKTEFFTKHPTDLRGRVCASLRYCFQFERLYPRLRGLGLRLVWEDWSWSGADGQWVGTVGWGGGRERGRETRRKGWREGGRDSEGWGGPWMELWRDATGDAEGQATSMG